MMSGAKFLRLKKLGAAFVAIATVFAAGPAFAGAVQGSAEITVVRPLSFVIDDGLDFGGVIRSNTAGTVTISPTGVRTATGGATLATGGGDKPATFAGQGTQNQRVDISLGANSIQLTGPGAPMLVHDFVIGSTPTAVLTTAPRRFTITAANGIFYFPVGATLDVGANQVPGRYTGSWTINLDYF